MTSKEKFEKWINENVLDPNLLIARNTEHAGKYQSAFMEQRWEVWQATQADQAETIAQLQSDNAKLREALLQASRQLDLYEPSSTMCKLVSEALSTTIQEALGETK